MNLSYAEIRDTTPIELDALIEFYHMRRDQETYPAGMICATISNWKRDAEKRPEAFAPSDFFPPHRPTETVQLTDEEIERMNAVLMDDFFTTTRTRAKLQQRGAGH